jgi:uncharacterized phage protein gp47/JayE
MVQTRPSFIAIAAGLWTDIVTGLGVPVARYSILGSLSRAISRALDNGYGYTDTRFQNAVPFTATGTWADAWAAFWGIYRKSAASAGPGTAWFVFSGPADIPAGTVFTGQNSIQYITNQDNSSSVAGTIAVSGLATTETGSVTNLTVGSAITLTSSIPNVVNAGTIATMTGGTDAETDAALMTRAQQARSAPPSGGAVNDYVTWALGCPNVDVTRAWALTWGAGYGTVIVYICIDDALHTNGFPSGANGTSIFETRGLLAAGDQLNVANYIYSPGLRPVTALAYVYSPQAFLINITIQSANFLPGQNSLTAISAINQKFVEIGTPLGMNVYESQLEDAIDSVASTYNLITPNGTTTIPVGYLPVCGTITWI